MKHHWNKKENIQQKSKKIPHSIKERKNSMSPTTNSTACNRIYTILNYKYITINLWHS